MSRSRTPAGARFPRPVSSTVGLSLALVALPALAMGQSLGEAARKERERRSKTASSAKVVTEEELASNAGRLANDPGASAPLPEPETREAPPWREAELPAIDVLAPTRSEEDYWRGRARRARSRVAAARRRHDTIQRYIRFGQPAQYAEDGRRLISSIHTMKAMADEAEAELRAAEKALERLRDEARRAGALPGWLRE